MDIPSKDVEASMRNDIVTPDHIAHLGPGAGWPVGHLAPGPPGQSELQSTR